jgi:hypothetical protein
MYYVIIQNVAKHSCRSSLQVLSQFTNVELYTETNVFIRTILIMLLHKLNVGWSNRLFQKSVI